MIATVRDRQGNITTITGEITRVRLLVDHAVERGATVVRVANEQAIEYTPPTATRGVVGRIEPRESACC